MKLKLTLGLLFILTLVCCQPEQEAEEPLTVEFFTSERTANRPFSEAVRVRNWIILSGQLGLDYDKGELVSGGIKAETKQTMENIKHTLEKYGSSLDNVVKCTVMLADISEWPDMNEVYVTYFPNNKPARSAFGTSGLALGARLEIECWAVIK
jgi:reactive intermediate/imine deaminase